MNKLSILFIILLFGSFTFLNAQTYDVTFQVDMNVKMVTGEFDSLRQEVRMTGTITDPEWNPAEAPILEDPDGDGIFATTLNVAAGDYVYKYLIGDAWGNDETLADNRAITVSATETLDPVFYSNVSEVDFPVAPQDSVILMLTVDMSRQRQIGAFDPNTQVVRCAGAMQGWSPENAPDMVDFLVGGGENLVYRVSYPVAPNTTYEYKFKIGTTWDDPNETNNRSVSVAANDTAIWPVYYNDEPYDPDFVPDTVAVTFNVDMSVKILEGLFDPTAEAVVVAGTWQGSDWTPETSDSMIVAYDSVFTSTVKMLANVDYEYKFKIGRSAEDTGWELNNRQFSAGGEDTVLATVFFDNDTIVSDIKDGKIEFTVDMSVLAELGLYDAINDSVKLMGDFNGWSDSDPTKSEMEQDFGDPNIWFLQITFEKTPVEEIQNFKFLVNLGDTETIWTDGWERPLTHGGGNRMVGFEGTETQVYETMYDDVQTDYVLNGGDNLQVTFSVDMRPAMLEVDPFNPAEDSLWWVSEQPLFAFSQGWPGTWDNDMKVLLLEDLDGDSIFTGTLTVTEPSFNGFEYRYGYDDKSAGARVLEPGGYANFAYRVRYAGQDAARSWPVSPWPMPEDVWTPQEVKDDQQEVDPYQSYEDYLASSIGDLAEVTPNRFKLYKNYPNPFNPSTNLKFDLPEAGVVKLNIYNVLGQKVATVYDGNLKAGQHIMTWSGKDVSGGLVATGVYFFRLETEKHVAVRKMVMLK